MAGTIEVDRILINHAAPTGGVCRRSSLVELGVSSGEIDRRVKAGFLRSAGGRGVYVVDGLDDWSTPLHRATALLPGATVSHLSAARLHRFPVEQSSANAPVHVIVPHHVSRSVPGVVLHRIRRTLERADVFDVGGVAVTSAARTLVDLAATVGSARFCHVVQTQTASNRPPMLELVACFDATARRGVNGVSAMRHLLKALYSDEPVSGSVLERAVSELLATNQITGFQPQYRPPWFDGRRGIVDFAHPSWRVIIEADGRRWHRRDQEMTEDRRRDRLAAKFGWLTVRITWAEVQHRPAATAADIAEIVAFRSQATIDAA